MERSTWQYRKQNEPRESSSGDSWFMSDSRVVKEWRHGACRTESAKIVTIKRCWCPKGQRPSVPCHHIREYRYAFGAVEPLSGESFFLTMPNCDTECTNIFLEKLSEQYPDDMILLVCDGAAWHKSKALRCPENIQLLSISPYTFEMNPIEQIWKQIRSMGFRNEVFDSLSAVMDRLCETICLLTTDMVKSITGRQWIIECF